jgi:outer membrane protein assembly factor BamE (lipoprotein component of BamABCDE complex)
MKTTLCLLIAVIALLCGCAGTNFTYDKAQQVQGGMTEQVLQIMGHPYTIRTTGRDEIWIYSYASTFSGSKSVSFVFTGGRISALPILPNSSK